MTRDVILDSDVVLSRAEFRALQEKVDRISGIVTGRTHDRMDLIDAMARIAVVAKDATEMLERLA